MTIFMAAALSALMIFTALLSGVFGMAGGLILIGVLFALFPVPQAMILHAVTQMASNGWRALLWWRHIGWRSMGFYVAGCLVAVGLWSLTLYVPDKAVALLMLGLSPFVIRAIPEKILPRTFGPAQVALTVWGGYGEGNVAIGGAGHAVGFGTQHQLHAGFGKELFERVAHVGVFSRHETGLVVDDGNPAAQSPKHLAEFDPNVAATHDDEVLGLLRQVQ